MSSLSFSHTVTERFLRYVTIDTQSDPESPTSPSTEKQKDLGRVLVTELRAMGVADAHLDDYGYVYATIPANTDKKVPVICFCSHMDTSPDVTGKDVKPQVVTNYRGGDIVLPGDTSQVIRYAEGKMEHAIKIAAAIVERLPKEDCSPETTSGKQGFLHPVGIEGALEQATLSFIVRDFTEEGLKEKEALLEAIVKDVMKDYPRSTYKFEVREQYRNMKQVIDRHPHVLEYAIEAIRRAGLRPMRTAIRGGTDGSRLSFMGLPCPNIFAGEHAFHSRLEWVSRQDMEKAVQTIVHLAMIWEEKA